MELEDPYAQDTLDPASTMLSRCCNQVFWYDASDDPLLERTCLEDGVRWVAMHMHENGRDSWTSRNVIGGYSVIGF